ncbi:hypothetical protein HZS_4451 [Henneguya salminicola]|nr:hypothetical protein HZS_4451 [Henneguya salminicola]
MISTLQSQELKCPHTTSSLYEFALNSLFYTGPDLDAYYIRFSFESICLFSTFKVKVWDSAITREILCTRSSKQIRKIMKSFNNSFQYLDNIVYNIRLFDFISTMRNGSEKELFLSLLQIERSTSVTLTDLESTLIDYNLFLNNNHYKNNKQKFIKLFATASYFQIRKICEIFQQKYNKSLIKLLKSYPDSVNSYEYFSRTLKKYRADNPFGIIRIIVSRAEIDLMNILRVYKNSNRINGSVLIPALSFEYKVYFNIILPLMGQ